MPRRLSGIIWSISTACGLLAALAACAPPHAYYATRLDSVPMPEPVLMARAEEPDCRVQAADAAPVAPAKQEVSEVPKTKRVAADVTGADFETEAADKDTEATESKDTETAASRDAAADTVKAGATPNPRNAELRRLEQERDCYKRAEQLARQRLEALQASSEETVAALSQIRSEQAPPGYLTAW